MGNSAGFSMGAKVSPITSGSIPRNPGPGSYNNRDSASVKLNYSFGYKHRNPMSNDGPGPGQYLKTDLMGISYLGKFGN